MISILLRPLASVQFFSKEITMDKEEYWYCIRRASDAFYYCHDGDGYNVFMEVKNGPTDKLVCNYSGLQRAMDEINNELPWEDHLYIIVRVKDQDEVYLFGRDDRR